MVEELRENWRSEVYGEGDGGGGNLALKTHCSVSKRVWQSPCFDRTLESCIQSTSDHRFVMAAAWPQLSDSIIALGYLKELWPPTLDSHWG